MQFHVFRKLLILSGLILATLIDAAEPGKRPENFQRDQLVAWCVVPFDSKERNPKERAAMLSRLGIKRVAYDWREKHVAEFETEIREYQENGIEMFAFWRGHPKAYELFAKHKLTPQIWKTVPSGKGTSTEEKITSTAELLAPDAERARKHGLKFGLYNHGGWGGLPENMKRVCEELHRLGYDNTGIVYNFHHAHHRIATFEKDLQLMLPHLFCLNLNGMLDPAKHDVTKKEFKIRPIEKGQLEEEMINHILDSGYDGPIGILGHVASRDVKVVLTENLEGLEAIFETD